MTPSAQRSKDSQDEARREQQADERIHELEQELKWCRRTFKDLCNSIKWLQAKSEGKMRKMQDEGGRPQHKRLREGRYEGLTEAVSRVEAYQKKMHALDGGGDDND